MKLLAIDTSSLACAAGVLADGVRHVRHAEREREHTRLLVPMIREVLAAAALEPRELDAVVLGNGPGSFIGLRIAAAVAEGIAHAAGLPVVPVSSLAAVAMRAGNRGDTVAVAQDAHMGEVYLGLYRIDDDGFPQPLIDERLQAAAPIDGLAGRAGPIVTAGAGWQRYPGLAAANRARPLRPSAVLYPHADELLALGARAWDRGAGIAPEDVDPAYLRHEVASPAPQRVP